MTRRLLSIQAAAKSATPQHPRHDIPSFDAPYYKLTTASVRIDEKDFSEYPTFIAEDLERSSMMTVIFEDMEPIDEEVPAIDHVRILICSDANGRIVYEHTEVTDGLPYQYIELKDCIRRLRVGSYTMYISNVKYTNEDKQSFDYHDNATVFGFKILSRSEVLGEPAPHEFTISTIGQANPLMTEGIRLDFTAGKESLRYRDFFCFNQDEVLMYKNTSVAPHIDHVRMISRHIWQSGHYTCLFDNGLIPIAAVEFDISPDGQITWQEGINEETAAYKLMRIKERDAELYDTMQENIDLAGDHSYTLQCIEWYEHVILNRLCSRYECPNLFENIQLNEKVPLPSTYNARHAMNMLYDELRTRHLQLTPAAMERLNTWFAHHYGEEKPWNSDRLGQVTDDIIKNFNDRRQNQLDNHWSDLYQFLTQVEAEDLCWGASAEQHDEQTDSFEEAMKELRGMVGLEKLKNDVDRIFTNVRFNQLRASFGLPNGENHSHHMLFLGNPGTGKTTVAKHIGKIFHAMGLLSDGDVIVTDRSKMVGRYIGDTETKMQELIEEAEGKVLFIDEAYSLFVNDSERSDYGHRVIESLLPKMAEANPDLLVIMAGYEKELEKMVNINPGLRGRFAHSLHFDDYTADELMSIALLDLGRCQYQLSEEARDFFADTIRTAVENKGQQFSNARWVEQYVRNGILPAMAERVMAMKEADASDCQLIIKDDIEKAWPLFDPRKEGKKRVRVGF